MCRNKVFYFQISPHARKKYLIGKANFRSLKEGKKSTIGKEIQKRRGNGIG